MSKTFGKKTILINSAYRSNPNSSSTTDFIYTFPETVKDVVHTNLLNAVIENGVYNVVAGVNDTFNMGFINYNTPNVSAIFNSPATQTLPSSVNGQNVTFAGTTQSGTFTVGATVTICDGNNGPLGTGIIISAIPTQIVVGLTSLGAGGSVITGFLINQYSIPSASGTSATSTNWIASQIGNNKTFTLASAVVFAPSSTANVYVVNTATNTIIGTASVVSSSGTTLGLKVATVAVSTNLAITTWAMYQVLATPVASTTIKPIVIPAKYYDLESLAGIIQDRVNQAIPTVWDLPPPLTDTKFTVKLDSDGYFYLINNDTGNWNMQFPLVGTQQLLGFAPLLVVPPATIPVIGPTQPNNPFEVISNNPMKVANYDLLLVQSDRLGNQVTSRQGFDCWWVIPNANSQNNSTTITYENVRGPLFETAWKVPRDFEFIDIRIVDKFGKVVDIGTNDIQLVVECFTDASARR